jgi:hypothetical protein
VRFAVEARRDSKFAARFRTSRRPRCCYQLGRPVTRKQKECYAMTGRDSNASTSPLNDKPRGGERSEGDGRRTINGSPAGAKVGRESQQ